MAQWRATHRKWCVERRHWGSALGQKWQYGLGAMLLGVLLPVVSGYPHPKRQFGDLGPELAVSLLMGAAFVAALLALAALAGRRIKELHLAISIAGLAFVHPVIAAPVAEVAVTVDLARTAAGSLAIVAVALIGQRRGLIGEALRNLAFLLATAAFVILVIEHSTTLEWIGQSPETTLAAAAILAGATAFVGGQMDSDGSVLAVGLMALIVGFGNAQLLISGSEELTIGVAVIVTTGTILAATAAIIGFFEALERRDAIRNTEALVTSLEVTRLTAQSARFDEVAHDQRTALLAIEAAARSLGTTPSAQLASAVESEVHRLHQMLASAPIDRSEFALHEALAPLIECLDPLRGPLTLASHDPVTAWGRPADLVEIVQVLIDNGREHGAGQITVTYAAHERSVIVRVSDEGVGVAGPLHNSIFERGVTTAPSIHCGLGLYTARRLARENRGELQVCAEDPATFELTLRADAPVDNTALAPTAPPTRIRADG